MLKIIGKISIAVLIAFILSVGVDYLYRQTYKLEYKWPKNLTIYPEITDKYDLVALGNSHTEAAVTFEKYNVKSLSLASVAQSFEYDLAMLKMYPKQIKKNAIILINVSPLSFSQKIPTNEDDANSNYYDGRLSPYLIPHLKIGEYLQVQIAPFVRAGYLWRSKYANETGQKAMNAFAAHWVTKPSLPPATPPAATHPSDLPSPTPTPMGATPLHSHVPTFNVPEIHEELASHHEPYSDTLLTDNMRLMVNKWYHSGDFDPKYFEANSKDLANIINYSLAHGWRPVLITIPISQVLTKGLNPDYLNTYLYANLKKVNIKNIPYFNFQTETSLTQDSYLFSNSDHLNQRGASIFSYVLLQKLIKEHYLPKSADSYDYHTLK